MLFENERLEWTADEKNDEKISDDDINRKYVSGEVRIVTEQARYPLDTIKAMIDSEKYNLMPSFQRRHRWSEEKQSRLIESFIMNVPIPPIFLYEDEYSHYEVMDGLQRMSAIYAFYSNDLALTGLEVWPELNGKRYSELPDKIRQGIDRRYLSSIVLLHESAKDARKAQEMKQLVFERINSGGEKLEPQETRNALYDGPMNKLCIELSRNKYLCYIFDIPNSQISELQSGGYKDDILDETKELDKNGLYRTMTDVELVLRFFAMRNIEGYSYLFNKFLDLYLIKSNRFSDELLAKLKETFEETIQFAYELFDKKAFFLWRPRQTKKGEKWEWFERPATTVYDPLMYVLTEFLPHKKEILSHVKDIQEEIKNFYQTEYSVFEGRNSNRNDIKKRIKAYEGFLNQYIGAQRWN